MMGIQGNRYKLNERIKELEYKLKKEKEENENLKNNRSITLKNIDLTGISKKEQFKKVKEEFRELTDAICEHLVYPIEKTRSHAIEEYFDLLQSSLGLLDKFGITAKEVMKAYPKHIKKLEKRGNKPREKKCSKCINCNILPSAFTGTPKTGTLICNKNKGYVKNDFAKECRCYEEQEE